MPEAVSTQHTATCLSMTRCRDDTAPAIHRLVVSGTDSVDGGDHTCQQMTETWQFLRNLAMAGIPFEGRDTPMPAPCL